jgi:hypothetical protein
MTKLTETYFQFIVFEKTALKIRKGLSSYLSKSKRGPSSVPWKRSSMDEAARHIRRQ